MTPRFANSGDEVVVRWRDPGGLVVQQAAAQPAGAVWVRSDLELPPRAQRRPGRWKVEALFEDEVVSRSTIRLD